jgi:hypothetical protein
MLVSRKPNICAIAAALIDYEKLLASNTQIPPCHQMLVIELIASGASIIYVNMKRVWSILH